jgi:hypothetical protein
MSPSFSRLWNEVAMELPGKVPTSSSEPLHGKKVLMDRGASMGACVAAFLSAGVGGTQAMTLVKAEALSFRAAVAAALFPPMRSRSLFLPASTP